MPDATPDPAAGLPPFYRKPVALRFDEYGRHSLAADRDHRFASRVVAVPLGIGEFPRAAGQYPIVFVDAGAPMPLAVLGLHGRNLMVGPDGRWREGHYVPAYIRRYPFILVETEAAGDRLPAIDEACGWLLPDGARADATRLFDASGGPSRCVAEMMELCAAVDAEHRRSAAFVQALAGQGILVVPRADRDGFRIVDEAAWRALPAETLGGWHRQGWTDLVALHLASQHCWQALAEFQGDDQNQGGGA